MNNQLTLALLAVSLGVMSATPAWAQAKSKANEPGPLVL